MLGLVDVSSESASLRMAFVMVKRYLGFEIHLILEVSKFKQMLYLLGRLVSVWLAFRC